MKLLPIFLFILVFQTLCVFGQKKNVYYLKNDGIEVESKDSADFIRIIQEPDSRARFYHVTEYYPNNERKFVGQVSSFEPILVYEGAALSFYKNGKRKENITYQNGTPVGLAYSFFPNGMPRNAVDYGTEGTTSSSWKSAAFKVVTVYDSTGKEMVSGGSGYANEYIENSGERSEGSYLNGFKDGTWQGVVEKSRISFVESYSAGKLIAGTSTLTTGKSYNYTKVDELPEFVGGDSAFGAFLSRTLKYPSDARDRGITGRVVLRFMVEPDGRLSNVEVSRSVHPSLDREAVRVLRSSPKWIPGKYRGVPTRVPYSLPLGFQLRRGF